MAVIIHFSRTAFVLFTILFSCAETDTDPSDKKASCAPYAFDKPDLVIKLPNKLSEVSGLDFFNDSIIVMISDDKPNIYTYNLSRKKIQGEIKLEGAIDLEDIVVAGQHIYALQSDGKIWKVQDPLNTPEITFATLQLEPPFELEGIDVNSKGDSLFVSTKYWNKKGSDKRKLPVFTFAASFSGAEIPVRRLFDVMDHFPEGQAKIPFHPSAIRWAKHLDQWLILSTNKKFLAFADRAGQIQCVEKLDQAIYIQPEGLAFDKDLNLYITNEGKTGNANLMKFSKLK
ncbi:MAG TPA: hypothetical protein VK907_03475 [Phnomibacter sp.]|nr:hypothetical protein [Phnomibacter sp.]